MKNPLYHCFTQAGVEAGYSYTTDYNGYKQEGFGPMQMTVKNSVRCSTALSYLKPIKNRTNLVVLTHAEVEKIIIENKKAVGVKTSLRGKSVDFFASKEVLLSAGCIGSPTILQRSGIGNPENLSKANVKAIHSLPGVGENLQDHIEIYFQYECKEPITLNTKLGYFSKFLIGLEWILLKKGLGATNHFESCAFIRSRAGLISPDIQYHFLPGAIRYDGRAAFDGHGFQVHVGPNKPKSRGSVTIKSKELRDSPNVLFNYLQHEDDIKDWRKCIRLTHEIMMQPAMDKYRGDIIQPNIDLSSNEEIDQWVRKNVESAYHPCGTCKMGEVSDELAVVDSECRVIGIEKLRVIDSSIFPTITNGNLNAPTIMAAEKVADLILGNKPLLSSNPYVWSADNWESSQRENTPARQVTVKN
jgi:choline dehydrogenase